MKRWLCILLPVLLLCGCRAEETLETVSDEWLVPAMAQPREVALRLPENTPADGADTLHVVEDPVEQNAAHDPEYQGFDCLFIDLHEILSLLRN